MWKAADREKFPKSICLTSKIGTLSEMRSFPFQEVSVCLTNLCFFLPMIQTLDTYLIQYCSLGHTYLVISIVS